MTPTEGSADPGIGRADERRLELYRQVVLAAIIGLTMAFVAFQAARDLDRQRLGSEFERRAQDRLGSFQRVLNDHLTALSAIEDFYAASNFVDRSEFNLFATPYLGRQRGLTALGWAPVVNARSRLEHEATAQADGFDDYAIRQVAGGSIERSADRVEYVPLLYVEPVDRYASMLGLDLLTIEASRNAVDLATRSHGFAAAGNVKPAILAGDGPTALVILPVRGPASGGRFDDVAGFVVAGFEFGGRLDQGLADIDRAGIDVRLMDDERNELLAVHHEHRPRLGERPVDPNDLMRRGERERLADISLTLLCTSSPTFDEQHGSATPSIVLVAGLLVTALGTAYLLSLVGRTARVEHLVVVRTAALTRTKETLAERVDELERALQEVHRLRALLPICSYCKRVKEGEDYSKSVEAYIAEHSPTQFSHGVCPDCYEKHVKPQLEEL